MNMRGLNKSNEWRGGSFLNSAEMVLACEHYPTLYKLGLQSETILNKITSSHSLADLDDIMPEWHRLHNAYRITGHFDGRDPHKSGVLDALEFRIKLIIEMIDTTKEKLEEKFGTW